MVVMVWLLRRRMDILFDTETLPVYHKVPGPAGLLLLIEATLHTIAAHTHTNEELTELQEPWSTRFWVSVLTSLCLCTRTGSGSCFHCIIEAESEEIGKKP